MKELRGLRKANDKMSLKKLFPGVYSFNKYILTKNIAKGKKVYGEELITLQGEEYRAWDPFRSKLAAAIKNGLKEFPIKQGSKILYLGSAEGTTISHLSDIVGEKGLIFGVDISARVMRKFIYLSEMRKNLVPILDDASIPANYSNYVKDFTIDVLYQDVSQKNQAEIFLKNSRMYLKRNGYGLLVIKVRSIDAAASSKKIIDAEVSKLEKEFKILQKIPLEPFDKEHTLVLCIRK